MSNAPGTQDRLTTNADGIWLNGRYHTVLTEKRASRSPKNCKGSCPDWGMCK